MDNNSLFQFRTPLSPQRSSSSTSTFDPSQFQMLYDQMQNNQDFLQKMQGILAMQSYQLTTEGDESQSFQYQRTNSNPMLSVQDDESVHKKQMVENLQSFQSMNSQDNIEMTPQSMQGMNQFYIDPSMNALLQDQYKEENSQISVDNDQSLPADVIQQNDEPQPQGFPIDPSMITPEYFQMFNQFYQMFSQLQSNMSPDQQQNLNDPQFLQNLMFTFFTQASQNQVEDDAPQSPKNTRDYNTNLPLAAIPESKESMLEDNSQWQTVKTNKLGLLMSASSAIAKEGQENHCSCCRANLDSKRKSCSNFNVGNYQSNQGVTQSQEFQMNKNEAQASQIMSKPFNMGSVTPSPMLVRPLQDLQTQYQTSSVNQNLNKVFQQPLNDPSLELLLQQRKQSADQQAHNQILHKYNLSIPDCQIKQVNDPQLIFLSPMLSPEPQQRSSQQELLSPKQIQQNKVIEYMIDNNDFSNYKQRREVIKGERMCRTLSRSISKGSVSQIHHRQQFSIYSQNNQQVNATHQHGPSYNMPESEQNFFSEIKINRVDPYQEPNQLGIQLNYQSERNPLMFFSPQLHSKAATQRGSCFEDMLSDNDQVCSPTLDQDQPKGPQLRRKRTQEKIKEIRRLNELQRGKENLKKSQTRKNLHKDQHHQQKVFEITELKRSKSKKVYHGRKQSQNVLANKENQKLLQSNYINHYEMSHENIMLSPNQDLAMSMEEEQPNNNYYSKKDAKTFKSLNSVVQAKYSSNNVTSNHVLSDQAQSPPKIHNLKFALGQRVSNAPSEQSSGAYTLRLKPQSMDLQNLIIQDQLEGQRPGQEIHIIKKPVQTEEFKKIQERLTKYYQTKKRDEDELRKRYSNHDAQVFNQQHNDNDTMSMTKTLSSFKSLMMKTMSQMSIQQDNNIQQQFIQGKTQRAQLGGKLQSKGTTGNQSMNVSSIQDDLSCADYSENLTKIISPKNLYNGSLASIKYRNPQLQEKQSLQESQTSYDLKEKQHQKNSCLPNSLFFKMQNQQTEDTLSLKYNSRQPSLCYCGRQSCNCDKQSKKDLLCHFQNFLQEMDKHQQSHQGSIPSKDSIYASPIPNMGNQSNHDFLLSNFHLIGMGRSSSLTSRLSRAQGGPSQRQSSVGGNQYPKLKRFSSGATLHNNMPLKRMTNNLQHCQSTHVLADGKGLGAHDQDEIVLKRIIDGDLDANTTQTRTQASSTGGLEKLDTNKEEEIRLINLEKDIMHKAFIEKTHKLNLQQDQRAELLLRIQRHKQGQQTAQNSSLGIDSVAGYGTNPNTSHTTATSNGIPNLMINYASANNSLEERRKLVTVSKQAKKISQSQTQKEVEINGKQERNLDFY